MIKSIDKVKNVQRVKQHRKKYRLDVIESEHAANRLYEKVDRMMRLRKLQEQIEQECDRLAKEIFDLREDHSKMIDRVLSSRLAFDVVQTSAYEHYKKHRYKYTKKIIEPEDFFDDGFNLK